MQNRKKRTTEEKEAKQRAYSRSYYEANKEEIKANNKAYRESHKEEIKASRESHKEEIKARDKAYYEANKEKKKAQQKARYEANKEKIKAYQKAYYEANKEKKKAQKERRKREREDGLIEIPKQKRQKRNPTLGKPIPLTEEMNRVDFESKQPNQSVSVSTQEIIIPQLSSIESTNPETFNSSNVAAPSYQDSNGNNSFYRNSLSSHQLFFGGRKQKVSLGERELGRARLPVQQNETKEEDSYFPELSKFFG